MSMNLDDLEAAVATAKKQLLEKQKQDRNVVSSGDSGDAMFSLSSVSDYLNHVKKEPREILEARFRKQVGIEPPKEARHAWLVARCAYDFQLGYYRAAGRPVPARVIDMANSVATSWPGPLHDADRFDSDDPTEFELWDDTRCVAVAPNPYSKGAARLAFFAVEIVGPAGIAFEPLAKQLEAIYETSVDAAQEKALEFFTKHVRAGLTKVVIVGE